MKKFSLTLLATTLVGTALFNLPVQAKNAFGGVYQPVTAVPLTQSQVVYYRTMTQSDNAAAHIYIDGEYQSALLPGGFNVFCLKPGSHSLGNFLKDAPKYDGKRLEAWRDNFSAGKTYYVRLGNGITGQPQIVSNTQAEKELIGLRQQRHTLSRASSVVACENVAPHSYKDYELSFNFGKYSLSDISSSDQRAVDRLISEIHRDHADLKAIEIIGHTDPIGKATANQQLGQLRAETIRQMLIEGGIPADIIRASSAGSSQPVIELCEGTRSSKIQCYSPNRRVVVRVDTSKS